MASVGAEALAVPPSIHPQIQPSVAQWAEAKFPLDFRKSY